MATYYENGWSDGWWTVEQVNQFSPESASEILARVEREYQNEVAQLPGLSNRAYAAVQAEYLEGWIAAARQSLGQMR